MKNIPFLLRPHLGGQRETGILASIMTDYDVQKREKSLKKDWGTYFITAFWVISTGSIWYEEKPLLKPHPPGNLQRNYFRKHHQNPFPNAFGGRWQGKVGRGGNTVVKSAEWSVPHAAQICSLQISTEHTTRTATFITRADIQIFCLKLKKDWMPCRCVAKIEEVSHWHCSKFMKIYECSNVIGFAPPTDCGFMRNQSFNQNDWIP